MILLAYHLTNLNLIYQRQFPPYKINCDKQQEQNVVTSGIFSKLMFPPHTPVNEHMVSGGKASEGELADVKRHWTTFSC